MKTHNTIINLSDSPKDVFFKMSQGNPGAINALMELSQVNQHGFLMIFLFDTWCIYGSDIYILWNDICGRDALKMACVLRATQMGEFSHLILKDACSRQDYSGKDLVPVNDLFIRFKDSL